jgi:hypothetical protein
MEVEDLRALYRDDKTWESVFQRLLVYKDQHGDCDVPMRYNDGGSPHLGKWVGRHREHFITFTTTGGNAGAITQERIDMLNSIGFVWELGRQDQYDAAWMAQFEDYKAFQQKYNTTKAKILANGSDDPITKTGVWLPKQVTGYRKYMANETSVLTEEKIKLLNSTGFTWTLKFENHYEKWLNMYFKIYMFHYQNNSTSVSEADGHNSKLVKWIKQQKENYKNGILSKLQIDLLKELDFDWTIDPPHTWDDMYQELVQYHTNHGSTLINGNINIELGRWTKQQRKDHLKGRLDGDKIKKLERLGFDWYATDVDWNAMFHRLVNFKHKYNTTLVPRKFGDDRPLANWIGNQRAVYGKYVSNIDHTENANDDMLWSIAYELQSRIVSNQTHFDRMKKLIDLGFVWDVYELQWMEMYQRLLDFKEVHNSTTIPKDYSPYPELGQSLWQWVVMQRSDFDTGELSERRTELLNEIDFVWDPWDTRWNEMFERLVEYKNRIGSTMVPKRYQQDPELGGWVQHQRKLRKEEKLSMERFEKLDSIGFFWGFVLKKINFVGRSVQPT